MLSGQLTAGGGDIVAAFHSLGDIDTVLLKFVAESIHAFPARTSESVFGIDIVERDKVDNIL